MQNNFQRDLINETGIFKLIIPSVDSTRQNHSFSLILLIVQFREQLIGGASLNAHRFSVLLPHRFLTFLLAFSETLTNFSSTQRRWWRRRCAKIIIGVGRADYSRTMRAAGPINGFLNDHCPGEYPVYIHRGGSSPPPLLLQQPQAPSGIPDSLAPFALASPRTPVDLQAKMKFAVAR